VYAHLQTRRSVLYDLWLTKVLYLENTYVSQAFPLKRLEVLKLLCAQAAVTIEKAQMYRSMEEAKQAAEAATAMKSTCTCLLFQN
jgi:GAF domain-containing protein